MNKKFFIVIIISFLTIFNISCKKEEKKGSIRFYKVKYSSIKNVIKVTGVIKPEVGAEIKVGSRISGTVERLYVKVGDRVKQGDLIAVIEHKDLALKVKELKYKIKFYKNQLESDLKEFPSRIKSKLFSIKSLEIKRRYIKRELQRNRALFKNKMLSKQELENIEKEYRSLVNTIRSEEKSLKALKEQYKYAVVSDRLKIKQLKQQLKIAEIDLGYAYIKAPISGTISSISTQEGETVAASFSAPVFVNIIDLNRLEAVAYIDETDIGKINLGNKVEFYVESFPGERFVGVLKKIYPKADVVNNVVTYKIEVSINKNKGISKLRPEMTAYLDIILAKKDHVLVAPLKCIKLINNKNFAFVKDKNGKIKKKEVEIGIVENGTAEIVKGLKKGDEIVSEGFKYVHSI